VALLAGLAALALVLATVHGVAIDSDSAAYTDAARSLGHGHGLTLHGAYPQIEATRRGDPSFPLVHWPPLFPSLLGGLVGLGGSAIGAARWAMVGLLAANTLLFGMLAWRASGGNRTAAMLGAVAFALSPVGLPLHSEAVSGPLFLLLAFSALELVARYIERERPMLLVAAGTLAGAGLLARYSGVALVAACFVGLITLAPGGLGGRVLRAGAFSLAVLAIPAAWLARNAIVADTATGRHGLYFDPPPLSDVGDALGDATEWFAPSAVPAVARGAIAVLVVAAGVLAVRGLRGPSGWPALDLGARVRLELFGIFALLHVATVVVGALLLESPIDTRSFAPAWCGAMLAAVGFLGAVIGRRRGRVQPVPGMALAGAVGVVLLAFVVGTIDRASDLHGRRLGFESSSWRSSPTLARVKALTQGTVVYSNAPDAVYVLSGRSVRSLPPRRDPLGDRANPDYAAALARLRRSQGVVAEFQAVHRDYLPEPAALGLRRRASTADGALYGE
jgi:hypothetical protein